MFDPVPPVIVEEPPRVRLVVDGRLKELLVVSVVRPEAVIVVPPRVKFPLLFIELAAE